MEKTKAIALIPARAGSKRVPGKNIRKLGDHPVLAYTIRTAIDSEIFDDVLVSTDSQEYADVATHYGASAPFLRSKEFAGDISPDIEWIEFTLKELEKEGKKYDYFSILRPTSPFRQVETIQRAWNAFSSAGDVDSLRAVEKCKQHPGKMWVVRNNRMFPVLPFCNEKQPWHSTQYQYLPEIYVQNASLEIAKTKVVFEGRTISGEVIMPFFTKGYEGFDINQPYDWTLAEELIQTRQVELPVISIKPYTTK